MSRVALQFDVAIFGNQPVPTIVRQARLAESLGYGGVWIIDSQLICRELYVTMTATSSTPARRHDIGGSSPSASSTSSP